MPILKLVIIVHNRYEGVSIEDFTNRDRPDTSKPISSSIDNVPVELNTLIHWIMVGPVEELQNKGRTNVLERSVLTVCQNIMYGYKSKTPISDSIKFRTRRQRENPSFIAVLSWSPFGFQSDKNKTLIN